jgi:hypothetical protein
MLNDHLDYPAYEPSLRPTLRRGPHSIVIHPRVCNCDFVLWGFGLCLCDYGVKRIGDA